jgi:Flp pilus assembly protein TadG
MHRARGQAIVELALVTLVLAVLVVGLVSASEIVQAQIGLMATAEEAAVAAALAPSTDTVEQRGLERGLAVADGYALRNGSLSVAVQFSQFEPGQQVRAVAAYELTARDIPLLVLGSVSLSVGHVEVVPQFRGLPTAGT